MMPEPRDHIADELLAEYADDPELLPDRAAVERHLDSCTACRAKVDDFRTLVAAMQEEEVWWLAEEIAGEGGTRSGLQDLAARLENERAEAERMLQPVLESPYRFTYANIVRRKRFHTGGVVRVLCQASRDACDREPRYALALAEAAYLIAESLPDHYYPGAGVNELRGTAWKEYAYACTYLAQFDSAWEAFHRAERAYRKLADPEIQLATVDLCRAALLWQQQRYGEALPLARSSAEHFARRRDLARWFDAKEWEAVILHRHGDIAAARETYRMMFDLADGTGDAAMKARAANNLATAYQDSGDIGSASKYLLIAMQLFEALEQDAHVLVTRWAIARLALAAGSTSEAANRLRPLIADFQKVGMADHAASAQLDLAEALLILGRLDEVEGLCSDLILIFRQAKLLTGALTAAAFLKEAAAKRTLTREHIQTVRTYLTSLEKSPDLPFAPPPDPN